MGPRRRHGTGAGRRVAGGAARHRRHRQPRGVDPPLRPSGGQARSAGFGADWRLDAAAEDARHHRRRLEAPASLARRRSAGREFIERLRGDREAAARLLLHHRIRHRPSLRARGARVDARGRRVGALPAADGPREQRSAARPPHPGGSVRALPAANLHWQDALLDRRPRHADPRPRRGHGRGGGHRHAPSDARHGAPRPAQRAGAHPAEAVCADPGRIQGSDHPADAADGSRLDGRREVPRRRHHRLAGGTHVGVDGAQPQPSRSGEPGRRRHGPRRGHAGRARRRTDLRRRDDAASADPRRRRVPRPGHRGRNAQPVAARRLPHRRHHPHHRQQPARLHRHARRVVQHQLRQRPRARVQDPDRPRERRRSGRLSRGGAAGVGIPGAVPQGFPDRPGRLSAPRPQRRRRAGVHAADDVSRHQRAPDGARALRHVARQARPR